MQKKQRKPRGCRSRQRGKTRCLCFPSNAHSNRNQRLSDIHASRGTKREPKNGDWYAWVTSHPKRPSAHLCSSTTKSESAFTRRLLGNPTYLFVGRERTYTRGFRPICFSPSFLSLYTYNTARDLPSSSLHRFSRSFGTAQTRVTSKQRRR